MMENPKNRTGSSSSSKCGRIPRAARLIDTAISIILCGIGLYHLTQPNKAWRSSMIELFCTMFLLTAAYRLSHTKAIVVNVTVAVAICALGIRHLIYGGGWKSGITELLFAVLLITTAIIIHRER